MRELSCIAVDCVAHKQSTITTATHLQLQQLIIHCNLLNFLIVLMMISNTTTVRAVNAVASKVASLKLRSFTDRRSQLDLKLYNSQKSDAVKPRTPMIVHHYLEKWVRKQIQHATSLGSRSHFVIPAGSWACLLGRGPCRWVVRSDHYKTVTDFGNHRPFL